MIELEKYSGIKSRHTCPGCNSKGVFVRYMKENGEYISFDVGRCNRESKCGYHKKPKEFFAGTANRSTIKRVKQVERMKHIEQVKRSGTPWNKVEHRGTAVKEFDVVPFEHFKATLGNYEQNAFVQFLLNLFPDDPEDVQAVLKMYFVGTYQDGLTVYWQIDERGKIRTGKIMRYDAATGKRQTIRTWIDRDGENRELKTDWMHCKIKKDFNLKQCFYGEHLVFQNTKPIAIVEAEKTAIIASICFPEFVWLAIGSKQSLKVEKIKRLGQRKVILYPDADGFNQWQEIAFEARRQGLSINVSNLIENNATATQKAQGYDLADYLINQQKEVNRNNEFVDFYNSKLETVINDENLTEEVFRIINRNKLMDADAIREIILQVANH